MPEDVTGRELDRDVRAALRSLSADNSEVVARHLVMAGRLVDVDPQLAYEHAMAAARRAGRLAVVRESAGVAAYAAGDFEVALRELRAAARMSGTHDFLPMMADCERGLGRPERALALAAAPEVAALDRAGKVEMRIVAAGARRDLGQVEAAVVTLQCRELTSTVAAEWVARLRYAYADALLAADRQADALSWFQRAADADAEGVTDADERVAELEGISFVDLEEDDGDGTEDGVEEGEGGETQRDDPGA